MRWPFRKREPEKRESLAFTDSVVRALAAQAAGQSVGDPGAIAALEANLETRLGEEAGSSTGYLLPVPADGDEDPLAALKTDIANLRGGAPACIATPAPGECLTKSDTVLDLGGSGRRLSQEVSRRLLQAHVVQWEPAGEQNLV